MDTRNTKTHTHKETNKHAHTHSNTHTCQQIVRPTMLIYFTKSIYIQGASIKNNPLAKRRYFENRCVFLQNLYPAYRGDSFRCLGRILLKYFDAFKSYEVSTKIVKNLN